MHMGRKIQNSLHLRNDMGVMKFLPVSRMMALDLLRICPRRCTCPVLAAFDVHIE
jgi:hypothetical protein